MPKKITNSATTYYRLNWVRRLSNQIHPETDGSRTIRGRFQGVSTPCTSSKRFLGSMTNIILAQRESKDRDVVGSGVGGTASWAWPDLFVLVFCRRRTLLLHFFWPPVKADRRLLQAAAAATSKAVAPFEDIDVGKVFRCLAGCKRDT